MCPDMWLKQDCLKWGPPPRDPWPAPLCLQADITANSKASVWRQFQNPHLLTSKKDPPTAWGNISCFLLSPERRLCGVCNVPSLAGVVKKKKGRKISDITWAFEEVGTFLDWAPVLIPFSVSLRNKMRTAVLPRFHSRVSKITVRKQTSFSDPRRNRDVLGWVRIFHIFFSCWSVRN